MNCAGCKMNRYGTCRSHRARITCACGVSFVPLKAGVKACGQCRRKADQRARTAGEGVQSLAGR